MYFVIALLDNEVSYREENIQAVNRFHLYAKTAAELICC